MSRQNTADTILWIKPIVTPNSDIIVGFLKDNGGFAFVTGYTNPSNFHTKNAGTIFLETLARGIDACFLKNDHSELDYGSLIT